MEYASAVSFRCNGIKEAIVVSQLLGTKSTASNSRVTACGLSPNPRGFVSGGEFPHLRKQLSFFQARTSVTRPEH